MGGKTVTLIIHGTFAADSKWWQLGNGLFADRLEKALAGHGIQGTVWYPAIEAEFAYTDFAWSGRNEHRERIKAAVEMAPRINSLAERLGCTSDDPMVIHLVGHSHGGNVILEILKRLDARVRPGKIVLLGTPLLRAVPAFRLARLLFASILTLLATLLITLSLISLVALPIMMFWAHLRIYVIYIFLGLASGYLLTILVGFVFGLVRLLLDLAWRVLCLPFLILTKRLRTQVYGPPPGDIYRRLGGRKILALSSTLDEAGLALLLLTAPRRYLQEKIRSDLFAFLDFVLLDFVIDIPEAALERWGLGIGRLQVLFNDYKVSDEQDGWAYPQWVVDRRDVTKDLQLVLQTDKASPVRDPESQAILDQFDQIQRDLADLGSELRRDVSISQILSETKKFVIDQVKLRHSLYYENDKIIEVIASAIAESQQHRPIRA